MQSGARIIFGMLGFAAILLSGCAARKTPAIPWATEVLVRPVAPPRSPLPENPADPIPDLRLEIPPPPAPLAGIPSSPERPRTVAPSPAQIEPARKPPTPDIVPDLTTQQSASLQRQTDESLRVAERNLAAASGRSLSATQADLASKVRSFISDAREAGRAGDWARALDLAQKAQVLSEQLAGSF
jgi:type IV secretory pathway VirB10-like protein